MSRRFPWNRLGIDQTHDTAAIRKAYADALRALDVDKDIAGFAELRRARDEALWLAARSEPAEADDLGLGDLDFDDEDDAGDDVGGPDYADDWEWDDSPEAQHPDPLAFGRPDPELTPELNETQRGAQQAWQHLRDMLYPDGQPSDESVTFAEMEEGLAQLDVLLARAAEADLIEHDALDAALAELFASTWPRSAPFVEPANAAFHWLDEAGSLEERPALRFLNQRLKGMRFHDKVQIADHPLHRAWAELARPGSASIIDRLRIKRLEVDKLLTGVRQHYPELESYLDPQRVASWEGTLRSSNRTDGGPGTGVTRILLVVFLVFGVLRACLSSQMDGEDDPLPMPAVVDIAASAVDIDAQVDDIFGEGLGMKGVRAADTVFADQLRSVFNRGAYSDAKPLDFVRFKALAASEVAGFEALVARAELRRLWVAAADRQPGGVCQNLNAGDFSSIPLDLNDKELARERALLRKLLDAGVLSHQPKGEAFQYAIPGWMVGEAIERTGLSDAALRKGLGDAQDANRCKIDGALLDIVLANPARVSRELLKGV